MGAGHSFGRKVDTMVLKLFLRSSHTSYTKIPFCVVITAQTQLHTVHGTMNIRYINIKSYSEGGIRNIVPRSCRKIHISYANTCIHLTMFEFFHRKCIMSTDTTHGLWLRYIQFKTVCKSLPNTVVKLEQTKVMSLICLMLFTVLVCIVYVCDVNINDDRSDI